MSEEKKNSGWFSSLCSSVLAPMAAGAVEKVGGMVGEKVVGALKEHFHSSTTLVGALDEAYTKGLDTLEIALAGPKIYSKTANKEFARVFEEEVLGPFLLQNGHKKEEFCSGALADLQILRSLEVSPSRALSLDELAVSVGAFAVERASEFEEKRQSGCEGLLELLRMSTSPPHHLAELLTFRNALLEALSLHFGRAIEKDGELFRHYFMCNAKGVERRLSEIQKNLAEAAQNQQFDVIGELSKQGQLYRSMNDEIKGGLKHVSAEVQQCIATQMETSLHHFGLIEANLEELTVVVIEVREEIRVGFEETRSKIEEESRRTREKVEELKDEISQKMDQFQNQMKQFLKARSMASKASMADSLSIRTADEKKMVREFLSRLREFPKDKIAGSTLADLGRLFGAIGESDEALSLNKEALEKASTDIDKATAHYNQFVTLLEKSQYERALEEYKSAISTRDGRAEFELFPSWKG